MSRRRWKRPRRGGWRRARNWRGWRPRAPCPSPRTCSGGHGFTHAALPRRTPRLPPGGPRNQSGVTMSGACGRPLMQLGDAQAVGLGAVLDRFLAAGERLGDRLQRDALLGERVELLDLVGGPGLAMAFEAFGHDLSF